VNTASIPKDVITQNSPEHTSTPQNIAPESTQSVDAESVTETTPKSDPISDEFDLGSPALVTEVTHQANEIHGNNGYHYSADPIVEKKVENDAQVLEKKLVLEDVRAVWQEFLNSLSQRVPKILELQVQRVQPSVLKGLTLTLECDNPLAQQMLKEQEMDLTMILKEHLGVKVRFNPIVSQGSKTNTQTKNPYERFKEIQQKDPILRELVERFGAELEY